MQAQEHAQAVAVAEPHRRADIQGLRAVAVLLVILYHAGLPIPGGFVGVDIFFVISGYVITAMLLREQDASGRISLSRFYIRRFKRLTPALALMLVATLGISVFTLSPLGTQQLTSQTAALGILAMANGVIAIRTGGYFDAPAERNPLLHTWSLSVEEQFYFFFPALLAALAIAMRRFPRTKRLPVITISAVGIASFALAVAGAMQVWIPGVRPELLGFYSPVTRAWEFAAGALLAMKPVPARMLTPRNSKSFSAIAAAGITGSALLITSNLPYPGFVTLAPVVATLAALANGGLPGTTLNKALCNKRVVTIGNLSYSLYLWHWPFISAARALWPGSSGAALGAALLSTIPAYASFRFVEQPIRTANLQARRLVAVVAVTVLVPLISAAGLYRAANVGFGIPSVERYVTDVRALHAAVSSGCDTAFPPQDRPADACIWDAEAKGRPIYLVGDSHAGHLSEAVIDAGQLLGRPVRIFTSNACPFLGLSIQAARLGSRWNAQCNRYLSGTSNWLRTARTGTVIISNMMGYWNDRNLTFTLQGDSPTSDSTAKLNAIRVSLTQLLTQLTRVGHHVVLVLDTPPAPLDPSTCSLPRILDGACSGTRPRQEVKASQKPMREILMEVGAQQNASILDLTSVLCVHGACASELNGTPLYRDSDHLSVPGSKSLAPNVSRALTQADR